jgi:hypothetical protein
VTGRYLPPCLPHGHPAVQEHTVVRLRRRRRQLATEPLPDGLPKTGLFAEPVRVASLRALDPEVADDDHHRVTFLLEVRDAEDRRCSDIAVEATVTGPARSRTVQGTTDLLGRIRFRTTGPDGTYRLVVQDVAAKGLAWDPEGGPTEVELAVP